MGKSRHGSEPLRIVAVSELKLGATVKFEFSKAGKPVEGFVANIGGRIVAYENVCAHIPLSVDCGDNRFFTTDGAHFVCHNHGALFEPLTGLCTRGPCEGEHLKTLPIVIRDGSVWMEGRKD
jgi:nitrite reductase/ring-hydroxylating ferredoxin subunit